MPNHDLARWQDDAEERAWRIHDTLMHEEHTRMVGRQATCRCGGAEPGCAELDAMLGQIHDATEVRMSDTWMQGTERHGRQVRSAPQGCGQGTDRAAAVEALVLDGTLESTQQGVPESASALC